MVGAGYELTIGLEEELILVDPVTLLPADEVLGVLEQLDRDARFGAEFRASQLELRTPIGLTVGDACRELVSARTHLAAVLEGRLRLAAVGTHPLSIDASAVTAQERFHGVAMECPWAARRGLPSGLHVHVGVSAPDTALVVYNALRSYLPELAALAANSPFFEGRESGLASTRLKLTEDLPRAGIPPAFRSSRELSRFLAWGRRGGLFADLTYLWWDLRPRPDYGTLELRVADVQTSPVDTAAVAAVCHCLVASLKARFERGERLPVHESHVLSENRWRAMRDGLDGALVEPETGRPEPTRDRIGRLLLELEPHADELGCADELAHAWSLAEANGAVRQREVAAREGLRGMLEWLVDESERRPGVLDAVDDPMLAVAV